ncbi:ADP-ribosylation factor-like protein 2-binding protein [Salarias fasciatus]|uniref:ADP-ribosylation factor-like protein 2-binding protein n=1 Tax=Salarias fasciatus TaxID=181472 RepID=A0A672I7N1_SALFA|nr:ADP-ribosylation factor-like protein 2-binding protein [Salarias fasciatus]
MDIQERTKTDVRGFGDIVDMEEEHFAASSSSAAETAFDNIIGLIEDIIMEEEFQQCQQSFMEKYYMEFEDSEENQLSYTPIFNEYVNLLEKHLEQQLVERIPGFHMNTFIELFMQHKDKVSDDILNMLLTFTDFMAFKEMFLEYRAEKEGRNPDLSQCLVITSAISSGSEHSGSADLQ